MESVATWCHVHVACGTVTIPVGSQHIRVIHLDCTVVTFAGLLIVMND